MRYFYTDPLPAAWMCHAFGMTFETAHGEKYGTPSMILAGYSRPRPHKHIIGAGSLHLLELQDGDIAKLGEEVRIVSRVDRVELYRNLDQYSIISRNGKPFHWPEVEA